MTSLIPVLDIEYYKDTHSTEYQKLWDNLTIGTTGKVSLDKEELTYILYHYLLRLNVKNTLCKKIKANSALLANVQLLQIVSHLHLQLPVEQTLLFIHTLETIGLQNDHLNAYISYCFKDKYDILHWIYFSMEKVYEVTTTDIDYSTISTRITNSHFIVSYVEFDWLNALNQDYLNLQNYLFGLQNHVHIFLVHNPDDKLKYIKGLWHLLNQQLLSFEQYKLLNSFQFLIVKTLYFKLFFCDSIDFCQTTYSAYYDHLIIGNTIVGIQ